MTRILQFLTIVLAVVATNLIGDSLRDALDPTTRERGETQSTIAPSK